MTTSEGMAAERRAYDSELYDGRRALPLAGTIEVDGGELRFASAGGPSRVWSIDDVADVQRVAGAIEVLLPPLDDELPAAKLVVAAAGFESQLNESQRRFGTQIGAAARRVGRGLGLRAWIAIALVAIPLCLLLYTVALPRLHVLIPVSKEVALGDAVARSLATEWPPLECPEFDALTARMLDELVEPDSPYEPRVTLVDSDDLNAVALPGGRIFIFRGLVEAVPSPDALAGVLAHELAHVEQRHGLRHVLRSLGLLKFAGAAVGGGLEGFETAETLVELSSGLVILKHSRAQELESDAIAIRKLTRANRSTSGLREFFETIEREGLDMPASLGWLSTHPHSSERVDALPGAATTSAGKRAAEPWGSTEMWDAVQRAVAELH